MKFKGFTQVRASAADLEGLPVPQKLYEQLWSSSVSERNDERHEMVMDSPCL